MVKCQGEAWGTALVHRCVKDTDTASIPWHHRHYCGSEAGYFLQHKCTVVTRESPGSEGKAQDRGRLPVSVVISLSCWIVHFRSSWAADIFLWRGLVVDLGGGRQHEPFPYCHEGEMQQTQHASRSNESRSSLASCSCWQRPPNFGERQGIELLCFCFRQANIQCV